MSPKPPLITVTLGTDGFGAALVDIVPHHSSDSSVRYPLVIGHDKASASTSAVFFSWLEIATDRS
jgi:hypothetical protein